MNFLHFVSFLFPYRGCISCSSQVWFHKLQGVIVCPSCDTQWQYQAPKAETIELEDEETGPSQRRPSQRSKRKRQRPSQKDDTETVGCSSQASVPISDKRRVTRSSARLR